MNVLHTADWHLGQKFLFKDRIEEHQEALDWLMAQIRSLHIDVLIISGDVFDIQNPPNYARSMYYDFLVGLRQTACRHVVVIGGNHDSPAMLDAPKALLKALQVHVVGCVPTNAHDQIIELHDANGNLEAVVAAVPFLRDQDIRRSVAGELDLERIERIKKGIYNHYLEVAQWVEKYQTLSIPIIATGHLYAKGAKASADQDNIYIANRENIRADQFSSVFDYVALGHIHRAQHIDEQEHIRYSGSLIPLRFRETKDEKSVTLIQFKAKKIETLTLIPVPEFRRLKTIEGNLEEVKERLERFAAKDTRKRTPWVEIILKEDVLMPDVGPYLRHFAKDMDLDILVIRVQRQHTNMTQKDQPIALETLSPIDVFEKKCAAYTTSETELKQLRDTFLELQNWMQERE